MVFLYGQWFQEIVLQGHHEVVRPGPGPGLQLCLGRLALHKKTASLFHWNGEPQGAKAERPVLTLDGLQSNIRRRVAAEANQIQAPISGR